MSILQTRLALVRAKFDRLRQLRVQPSIKAISKHSPSSWLRRDRRISNSERMTASTR